MKLMKRGVALALIAAWGLVSLPVQAYEKDKTYKITILHTNDHHGHFWRSLSSRWAVTLVALSARCWPR